MNEEDVERFEAELRRMAPARPPEEILTRLRAVKRDWGRPPLAATVPARRRPGWRVWGRWLAPALAMAAVMIFLVRGNLTRPATTKLAVASIPAGLKADDVQVDQELVSSFDVVATLPGGEPVRYRCRQMKDEWVVTDRRRGVEIKESRPRVEVTPVRFETY